MPSTKSASDLQVRVWRALWWNALEHFTLQNKPSSHILEGSIVGVMEKKPLNLHYHITADQKWQTRQVEITSVHDQERKSMKLTVDQQNRWWQDDRELAKVRGALDVDINLTPSTNTLPIKRLKLFATGKSGEITTAWIEFPKMSITPGHQTYKNLGHRVFSYKSKGFETKVNVDRFGLVEDYPPYWKREA